MSPLSRRAFLKTGGTLAVGAGWFGGAHLLLRDDRWTPNTSYWVARGRAPVAPPLRGQATADLAVIGAGVTGLSTAVHALLRHPGLRVVVLEAHYAGYGATGRSGGVLGEGTERGVPEGTDANVARVLDLVDRFGIDCDLERAPVAQLDPYRYAAGLKRAAAGLGAVIHEGTRVASIVPGRPVRIVGDGFALEAPRLAVATNGYTPKLGIAADRIFPVHTAAAVTGPLPAEVLAEVPDSIFVSTSQEMYMWGRKAPGGRVLVGAGARYFYDNGLRHRGDGFLFPALHRVMAREFPPLAPFPFEHTWTGPMGCTVDQEPILGRTGEDGNIFYGGAYSGHGLAMGTRMGEFLAGAVDGATVPAWLGRDLTPVPPEPLRYVGVNMTINLMNLGLYSMAKHER